MKELYFFTLPGCPYCRQARLWLDELAQEGLSTPITTVDEGSRRDFANTFDYWLVPCFFYGGQKLHEGAATKEKIRAVLEKVINERGNNQ